MQRQFKVVPRSVEHPIGFNDGIITLGSCFSTYISDMLKEEKYNVVANPFGTLFNPASIASSIMRLESGTPFTEEDCIQMGSGSSLWCSLHHYTKHARESKALFLNDANEALKHASHCFRKAEYLILTFGTAFCFRHNERDLVVANCLKRDQKEFTRFVLSVSEIVDMYRPIIEGCKKKFIFTVSPVRHLADGAHGNQISKAVLLLAINKLVAMYPDRCFYFPAYEIVIDELRDYKWFQDDTVHPNAEAQSLVWYRFKQTWLK